MPLTPETMQQLFTIFQAELEESATALINGLVDLEKSGDDSTHRAEDVETIFRTAHNLKGAARGLGITQIGDIAHQIESIFSTLKSSNGIIPKSLIDLCLEAVDKMQLVMQSFVDHKDINFDLDEFLVRLKESPGTSQDASLAQPVKQKVSKSPPSTPTVTPKVNAEVKSGKATANANAVNVDTIRVSLKVIDKLSELSEEVQAGKIEMDDRASQAKILERMVREFSITWKGITTSLQATRGHEESSILLKSMTRASDAIMEMTDAVGKITNDIVSQSLDYSRLSRALQDEVALLRLIPANNFLSLLPRYIRELSSELSKKVDLVVNGGDVRIDKYVLEGLKDPLNHILRNAIDHGIESPDVRIKSGKNATATITVTVRDAGNKVFFEIKDDGAGLDDEKIKNKIKAMRMEGAEKINELTQEELHHYIFQSGFSTKNEVSSISGRGVGLDVVLKNVQALKGTVTIESQPGKGCKFIICVPLSLSSERGLIVRCDDETFVLPTASIERVRLVHVDEIVNIEGSNAILIDDHPVLLKTLANVLSPGLNAPSAQNFPVVIIKGALQRVALAVNQVLGEREIVIKSIQEPLTNIGCVSGATLLDRNKIAIILDPEELIKLALGAPTLVIVSVSETKKLTSSIKVLVVDDSITTRTLEKNILESKNYDVMTAVNGQEAWDMLQKHSFSLVITDVNMPIMDGFELTDRIKKSDKFANLPVIIVTSLGSDSEKGRGIDVGADAYIVKSEFESGVLLQAISQLV